MAVLATTKMSSKGQVVIPDEVRRVMHLDSGVRFVVHGEGDTLILKRLQPPSRSDLRPLLTAASKAAQSERLTEAKLRKAVGGARRKK